MPPVAPLLWRCRSALILDIFAQRARTREGRLQVELAQYKYLLPRLLANQTMAVYTAEPVADAIAVTCTAILFSVQFRKALRKLEEPAP